MVVAFPSLCLALHRERAGRNRRDFLLRDDFAAVLRERSLPRLRALQANERRHAETTASRAPEVNDGPTGQKSLTFSNPDLVRRNKRVYN